MLSCGTPTADRADSSRANHKKAEPAFGDRGSLAHHADRNITAWCGTILASLMFAGAVLHNNAKNRPPPRIPALSIHTNLRDAQNSTWLSLRSLALLLLVVLQTEIIIYFNDKSDQ